MIGDMIRNQFLAGRDSPSGGTLGITLVLMFAAAFRLSRRMRSSAA